MSQYPMPKYPMWHKSSMPNAKIPKIEVQLLLIIFRYFFERKIFNSVVGVFFRCPETAHDAQSSQICRVDGFLSGETAVGKPEVTDLNLAIDHSFYIFFRYSLTPSDFLTAKISIALHIMLKN